MSQNLSQKQNKYQEALNSIEEKTTGINKYCLTPNAVFRYCGDEIDILQELIDKCFDPSPYSKFEDLEDAFAKNELPNFVIYDKNNEIPLEIKSIDSQNKMLRCFVGGYDGLYDFKFEENRFYLVNIPNVGEDQR